MESNDKMVDHPGHYEKGDGHPECIELLTILTKGYDGIAAGCVMQTKYAYRAGSKGDASLTIEQKIIQDFKKLKWYLVYFRKSAVECAKTFPNLPIGWNCSVHKDKNEIEMVVHEFIYDKGDLIKDDLACLIRTIAEMKTFSDVDFALEKVDSIISKLEDEIT